ncbi:MAG TPA: hypothetical protein DEQ02_03580 [Ruminococcaceae bacterium]|nr:hypothetical protein [Oscillospiraceae bacterium]
MQKEPPADCLGTVIKTARKSKGWTQAHLAGLLKITPRHLKAIENSDRKPSYDLFVRLIRHLDIPADTIIYPEIPFNTGQQMPR